MLFPREAQISPISIQLRHISAKIVKYKDRWTRHGLGIFSIQYSTNEFTVESGTLDVYLFLLERRMMMLSPENLQKLKSQLLDEQKDLLARLDQNDHFGNEQSVKEAIGELSNYDNHPADQGSELFEREKDIALNEHAEEQLQEIMRALDNMENGDYGRCQICHQEISYERLQALPTTSRCIEHAANRFVSESRPIEEEILRPAFGH